MYSTISGNTVGTCVQDRARAVLADSWSSRTAVRTGDLDIDQYYDKNIPDYPPHLVPFKDDARYKSLSVETRQKILAGAWVAYNEKTMDVEMSVTAPACALLLKGAFPGLDTASLKRLIAQTQIDEQFHVLMSLDACLLARRMHNIEDLIIPKSYVALALDRALSEAETARDAELIQIAFAAVAEVTVNEYLNILASDESIQPFNRETTALHRKDELDHRNIYEEMVLCIFKHFSQRDRSVFVKALTHGLDAFVKIDFGAWESILNCVGVNEAEQIIGACQSANKSKRIVREYTGFRGLLSKIGIPEKEIAFDFS